MKRGGVVLVCAFALLAVGAVWLVRRDVSHDERGVSETFTAHELSAVESAVQLESAEATVETRATRTDESSTSDDSALRSPLAPQGRPELAGPLLRVVAAESGAPLAHATVYWSEFDARAPSAELLALGPEHAAGPWPPGTRRFVADDEGRLQLPRARRRVQLVGFAPGHSGAKELLPDWRSSVVLKLDPTLHARIVTATGAPVPDVAVRLVDASSTERSDAAGRVRIVVERRGGEADSATDFVLRAEPSNLYRLDTSVSATVDRVWTVALPATGALDVRFVDAAALFGVVQGELTLVQAGVERNPRRHELSIRSDFDGDRALVSGLPVGHEYDVTVRCDQLGFAPEFRVRGPRVADEAVIHQLRFADDPIVVVRALTLAGETLSEAYVHVDLVVGEERVSASIETSADDRVFVRVAEPYVPGTARVLRFSGPESSTVELDISRTLPRGVSDLGEVRLGPAEVERPKPTSFGGRKRGGTR